MKTTNLLWIAMFAAGACGGGNKGGDTTPTGGEAETSTETVAESAENPDMVPPDQMDQIQKMFERKQTAVSRCLGMAIDNKDLPKNSRGKITLGVVISPSGKAEQVKVINATLESKSLTDCVVEKVKEIQFPTVPKPYETSYSYAFEAN